MLFGDDADDDINNNVEDDDALDKDRDETDDAALLMIVMTKYATLTSCSGDALTRGLEWSGVHSRTDDDDVFVAMRNVALLIEDSFQGNPTHTLNNIAFSPFSDFWNGK